MTFSEFVTAVEATVFPEGVAENLVSNHRKYITDALIDIQQKIPSQQTKHRDEYTSNQLFFDCGSSVFTAPRGFLTGLHTILTDCCDRVFYDPVSADEMQCLLKDQQTCGYKYRAYGFYEYDEGSGIYYPYSYTEECLIYTDDQTDKPTRASSGWWSLSQDRIYVFPHIQSDEIIVLEWDGLKRSWLDSDEVSFDREIQEAVELYLEWKTTRREDFNVPAAKEIRSEYAEKIGMLIHQYRKEQRIPRREPCFSNCDPCCSNSC